MNAKVPTIACNCLILGMGNVPVEFMAESYDEVLLRLHADDENDRYCDGFHNGLPLRVYRVGLAGIGPKSPITQVRKTILMPAEGSS